MKAENTKRRCGAAWLAALVLGATGLQAQAPTPDEVFADEMTILGDRSEEDSVPGSAHQISQEELDRQGYSDVHRILRQVPGVMIQEEDGFGLRPNIGLRGTGVERSQKITLLEDGVLAAPAPYAAPAAYYSPTAGRMAGFEVRKGSVAIEQGPYTLGGAVNYLSTPIPGAFGGRLQIRGGEHGTGTAHLHVGDQRGRFGWLVEGFRQQSDGFKDLDGGGETGFELDDFLIKLRVTSAPEARFYQALELKLGHAEQVGDETYLGLTADDFEADPFRRYVASGADRIDTEHEQVQLNWFLQLRPGLQVSVVAYRNDFFRNWHKLQSVEGASPASVLDSPEDWATELGILRGELDSTRGGLALRNNRRDYASEGLQAGLAWQRRWGAWRHDLDVGLRFHRDEEDRFQEEDAYSIVDGELVFESLGAPGSQANRLSSADAWSLFARDTIRAGAWTISPGLRVESIDLERLDWGPDDPDRAGFDLATRENTLEVIIPGLGIGYRISDAGRIFGGLHRGFAPPGPGSSQEVDEERSWNWELGTRWRHPGLEWELVAFLDDYQNLLGRDTLSGGGTGSGESFNGGAATIHGLEAGLELDLAPAGASLELPLRVSWAWTSGEFDHGFETSFVDWAPEVRAGDELPYLAEHSVFVGLSARWDTWALHLDTAWVDEMRTRAGRGPIPEAERIEPHATLDLAVDWAPSEAWKLSLQIRNVTDEVYVAARRPAGLRPGLPRTAMLGLTWDF